jgi:hypothetical protein
VLLVKNVCFASWAHHKSISHFYSSEAVSRAKAMCHQTDRFAHHRIFRVPQKSVRSPKTAFPLFHAPQTYISCTTRNARIDITSAFLRQPYIF